MKKIFILTLTITVLLSFKGVELKGNEFKISGTISTGFNGKKVYLAKQEGQKNIIKIDSAVVKKGKFSFEGTAEEPQERMLFLEGKKEEGVIQLYAEKGIINVTVDTDSISKSTVSGTLNNDALAKLTVIMADISKKEEDFKAKNFEAFNKAKASGDIETQNRIAGEYELFTKEKINSFTIFIEQNPKSVVSIKIFPMLLQDKNAKAKTLRPLFDQLSVTSRESEIGKKIEEYLNKIAIAEKALEATDVGKKAPDFSAPTPDGNTFSLKEGMGKVTIIDFWASWCGPCRKENPNVVAMYNELHDKGLNIIGVSLDKDAARWKKAIADDNLTWYHISNLKFWEDPIAKQYAVSSIPATVVLDENGTIVARNLRGAELKAKVLELLNK